MPFKRLTVAQREALRCLRALGAMVPSPQDARSLKILAKRGLVRYRMIGDVRHAVLRDTPAQQAVKRRLKRATKWMGWTEEPRPEHE